jgi:hypothetical protein
MKHDQKLNQAKPILYLGAPTFFEDFEVALKILKNYILIFKENIT